LSVLVSFRWLGAAGIELHADESVLLIDPFLTRPRFLRMWFGRVEPAHALIAEQIPRCDAILITHSHFDHLMDVPDVVRNTGATAFGSPNTCRLLAVCGTPGDRLRVIAPGDHVALNEWEVEVFLGVHEAIPGFGPGTIFPDLRPPLRLRDYRMDINFTFLLQRGDLRLLVWTGARPEEAPAADVLFVKPIGAAEWFAALLNAARPRLVVPIHWDDLFRPLSKPTRPYIEPPRLAWPPLRRMDPGRFRTMIERIEPATAVLTPQVLRTYEL
jgi:L-ascorbate metabolism protein UlaG (beta-lactamase superfamily)